MRGSKVVRLDNGREVTVKEISPRMVLDMLKQSDGGEGFSLESVDNLCREGCGMSSNQLADLYGSEIQQVWEAFQEVNTFFFKVAATLGLDTLPERIGAAITGIFSSELAALLSSATSMPPGTDGSFSASSSMTMPGGMKSQGEIDNAPAGEVGAKKKKQNGVPPRRAAHGGRCGGEKQEDGDGELYVSHD